MTTTLDKQTTFELLQVQLVQYLMVEKYGLRAERNAANPPIFRDVIQKEEIQSDIERLLGENNSKIVDALYWVINDATCNFNPTGWDDTE